MMSLLQALAKEKGETSTDATNSNEKIVSNKVTVEQSSIDKTVSMTSKDNTVTTAPTSNEEKVDDVSIKEKDTIVTNTQDSTTPTVTHAEEDKVVEAIKDDTQKTEEIKKTVMENNTSTQEELDGAKSLESTTLEVASAEVSMEMDDLVVHTVDEDDFKIEQQSRDHVSKKSNELPSSTTDEKVNNIVLQLLW